VFIKTIFVFISHPTSTLIFHQHSTLLLAPYYFHLIAQKITISFPSPSLHMASNHKKYITCSTIWNIPACDDFKTHMTNIKIT
jgi:hypothetical protein